KASFNRQLAQALAGLLPSGATAQFIEIGELPLYNQDLDANLPEPVQRFKAAVAGVDALLFVTPEYNRGIPGVLKNAIDWGSR
ncbi:NAD(P)H-dependent oxidoreductase, partial [Mycobacterium tuberculosis]|nr:NAD(P)H-dependent oxidoreductase [Mycobacterium tuberculosis]